MELIVSGKLFIIEENMRMFFSFNFIYIISINFLNEDDCDEMFCELLRVFILIFYFFDNL